MGDSRVQRERQSELADRLDRAIPERRDRMATLIGRVYNGGAMPTRAKHYFAVHPVGVAGDEGEGSVGTENVVADAQAVVLVLGGVPSTGDDLVAFQVGDRWVAQIGKGSGTHFVQLDGCLCSKTPVTLRLVSSDHTADNGMFQDCTLAYAPTPDWAIPLALGDSSFLSTESFTDNDTGDSFRYYFACNIGIYILSRVYEFSIYGSPFRDIVRYIWNIGMPGNDCEPFALTVGQVFSGGDPTVVLTVTG